MTANVPTIGDRHGDQRDDRRPPVLQEHQHDDGDQDDRVAQRLEHLVDRLVDERRGVVDDGVVDARRGSGPSAPPSCPAPARRSRARWSRAAGRSTAPPTACRRACRSGRSPGAPSSIAGHVARGGRCRPSASVLRMMSSNCSASVSRPSVLIVYWNTCPVGTGGWPIWPAATCTFCCSMAVTTSAAVRLRDGHLLRVEPDPHAVVALAEVGDVADARQPRQLVAELDGGVVAQVEAVAAAVGREQVDDHQHAGRLLLDRDAAALDQVGQHRLRPGRRGSAPAPGPCSGRCRA